MSLNKTIKPSSVLLCLYAIFSCYSYAEILKFLGDQLERTSCNKVCIYLIARNSKTEFSNCPNVFAVCTN